MKKIYQITFSFINITMILLTITLLINTDLNSKTIVVNNLNSNKLIHSNEIFYEDVEVVVSVVEEKKDEVKKEVVVIDKNKEKSKENTSSKSKKIKDKSTTKKEENKEVKKSEDKQNIVKEQIEKNNILETVKGKISAYSNDCIGCGNKTASGFDISKTIYYEDVNYGKLRVLAGDKKYPYGTVVNIKIDGESDIKGIVLDRGGDIGLNKKFLFDILVDSNKSANKFGVKSNVVFEILRLGY